MRANMMIKKRVMVKEQVSDNNIQAEKSLNIAKVLITLAVYFIVAASLLEHFSTIFSLKTLGFMFSAHSFYFLWKYQIYRSSEY